MRKETETEKGKRERECKERAKVQSSEGKYFLDKNISVLRFRFWTPQHGLVWIKHKAFVDIYLPTHVRTL